MRDYRPTDTIRFSFSTNDAAGAPATAAGTVTVFKDGSAAGSTLGVTLTPDFAGEVGANRVTIDGATALLTPGSDYAALFEGTVGGVAAKLWVKEFSVMNQGADVVSRGQLAAVTASGGTLAVGTFARAKAGDAVRMLSGDSVDYVVMDTLDAGTGVFTFVEPWDVLPAVGDYYEAVALPRAEPIKPADVATSGLAKTLEVIAVGVAVTDVQDDVGVLSGNVAVVDGIVDNIVADTVDIQTRLPAALVAGKMDATADVDTGAVAEAVFARAVESGLSFEAFCRLIGSVFVGLSTGVEGLAPAFKSADVVGGAIAGTKTRINAILSDDSERITITVDLS